MDTCSVRVFPDLKLGVGWLRGSVTGPQYLGCIRALFTDELWQPGYATLWQVSEASEVVFLPKDIDDVMSAWDELRERRGDGKLAYVVGRPVMHDLFFLLAVKDKDSNRPTALFWSVEEALKWIGVKETSIVSTGTA
ncbi:MAG TPA: hypothetical protein VFG50_15470 [Rhodothermales bacterium]|nr:hypothetical protein [Rhodothermales bacterium]